MEIIVASNNKGKIKEIRAIFGANYKITSMSEAGICMDIEENGTTFLQNALIKAETIYKITQKPVLSDDSGLMVDALSGQPGVYSARYSGAEVDTDYHNNQKLLSELEGVCERSARFVSAVVFYYQEDKYLSAECSTEGEILLEPRGEAGFGYDPIFYSIDLKKSFGEADLEEKNAISHRGRALRELAIQIDKSIADDLIQK